jgi:hypothetical protein
MEIKSKIHYLIFVEIVNRFSGGKPGGQYPQRFRKMPKSENDKVKDSTHPFYATEQAFAGSCDYRNMLSYYIFVSVRA